ncbi:MAG: RIP metalloprotease RseP [Roseibium sp.]|uniref:RIP metalloprotease RseP n=1 Tax=Roseibium sp. TaxID=1936156 RepID=UPI001B192E4F|nr:RIP metalloprotease RseP [Roseibium sp.]MBO6892986.1 RIP metalloprotease RseP [Roseibium sp.]MBO6929429.1 RIP metalloprotease RseP [Roseibium sp.]
MDLLLSAYSLIVGTIIPFLFVLTIVVFFHELGHFAVARWCNIKVDAFSVGFGREIFGRTDKKGTRWKLCLIPLGGYVKFAGDENAASVPNRELIAQMSEEDRKTAFIAKPVWQRAAVVAAGPLANFLLAIVIFATLFMSYGKQGIQPVVEEVFAGRAAERGGLQAGDIIKEIDGREIHTFNELRQVVLMNANTPLVFDVDREGTPVTLTVTPDAREKEVFLGERQMAGDIGLRGSTDPQYVVRIKYGLFGALEEGARETYRIMDGTVSYIWGVITQRQSADQLGGPIRVAQISGQVAELGIMPLISLTAVLSVSIGLINLAPVPILDGGHLVFYAAEALRGKPLSERVQDVGFRIGLGLVLMLMVFVTWKDIVRLVSNNS